MKEKRYSISEASRLLEVENHVLRYWEEELELNIPRNELGHRFYREEEIQLLNCIKELKNKGFQLKAVKEVLPDLEQKKLIDVHKLLATQVELESMGIQEREAAKEEEYEAAKAYGAAKERQGIKECGAEEKYGPSEGYKKEKEYETERDKTQAEDEPLKEQTEGKQRNLNCKVVALRKGDEPEKNTALQNGGSSSLRNNEEKMKEFESIMGRIIGKALREQAENIGDVMGDRISSRVIQELDDVLEEQEEREEARYKKLDEAIRSHQKARQEIAVAKEEGKKKSRFFRKNKRKI